MLGLVPFKFNNGENNRGLTINDMFNDFFNNDMLSEFKSCGSFKTDIKETPEEYVVHAELPGVKKEDINIDYNNNYLTISYCKGRPKIPSSYDNEINTLFRRMIYIDPEKRPTCNEILSNPIINEQMKNFNHFMGF